MCIAIVKKQGAVISDEQLRNSFRNNPDGAGIAYATKDGILYYVKGIFTEDELIRQVRKAEEVAVGAMLIHCRIGTSGKKDKDNCHPHVVNNNTVMIHNGILPITVPDSSKVSDTVIYCQEILAKLPKDFMNNEAILKLIESDIGSNNKFAFLNNKGEYKIVNEDAGKWEKGVWYSNDSHSYDRTTYYQRTMYHPYSLADEDGYGYDYEYIDDAYMPISKNKLKKLQKKIRKMSDEQLLALGDYPIYDLDNNMILGEYELPTGKWMYLEELSQELYWDFVDEVEMRGLDVA